MYENTPSFYRDQETFERFLGYTSYYRTLQDAVCKLLGFLKPSIIVELGSGTGTTAIRIASEVPDASVTAVDNSSEMIRIGRSNADSEGVTNVQFILGDMRGDATECISTADLVLMLHSFHHIEDPLENKVQFLELCFSNLKPGSSLCIAETFIPVSIHSNQFVEEVRRLWKQRIVEARSSSFWNSLKGFDDAYLAESRNLSEFAATCEDMAGRFVEQRMYEYCIALTDLESLAIRAGFRIRLMEPVNSVGDAVVLLVR